MVDIQSKEVIDKISELLKIQPALVIPRVLGKDIQLTFPVSSENFIDDTTGISSTSPLQTTGNLIALTTPAEKDFYLTYLNISYSKDVVCDIPSGGLNVTAFVGGRKQKLISLAFQTLTAENDSMIAQFIPPIKIDRNSEITLNGAFTVGVLVRTLNVGGFTRDPQ